MKPILLDASGYTYRRKAQQQAVDEQIKKLFLTGHSDATIATRLKLASADAVRKRRGMLCLSRRHEEGYRHGWTKKTGGGRHKPVQRATGHPVAVDRWKVQRCDDGTGSGW